MRVLLAATALASACSFGATARAAEPCEDGQLIHYGMCYVQYEHGGGYNCTILYTEVAGHEVCLLRWDPYLYGAAAGV